MRAVENVINMMNNQNSTSKCLEGTSRHSCAVSLLAAGSAAWISFFCASNSLSKATYLGSAGWAKPLKRPLI